LLGYYRGVKEVHHTPRKHSNAVTFNVSPTRPKTGPSLFFLTVDSEGLRVLCEAMSDFRGRRVEGANLVPYIPWSLRVNVTSKRMEMGVFLSVGTKVLDSKVGLLRLLG
jgi:hypothetical protein